MERTNPLAKNKVNQEIEKEPMSEAEAENDENADDETNKSEAPADQSETEEEVSDLN